ncbi:hypothetical protein [Desulfobacula sp.]|uniref:hypothetical protein n=1 Tax=Desulfobacula sp. TaxID=2593537 RepID=UPI0026054343|nr:hypothetical protein [Desulfobacula sp.]
MKKDVLDEVLEAPGKSGLMFKELIENGLSRTELLKTLFERPGMERENDKILHDHYKPYLAEYKKQIGFLNAIINNPAPDWMNDYIEDDCFREKLLARKENYIKKRNNLYTKKRLPTGTWKAMVGRKVVILFNLIKPVVEEINEKSGRKQYRPVDIFKLIARLWNFTYGRLEGEFTGPEMKKLYDNNLKFFK